MGTNTNLVEGLNLFSYYDYTRIVTNAVPEAVAGVLRVLEGKVLLAGGAVRRIALGDENDSMDFDLWPDSLETANAIQAWLTREYDYAQARSTGWATTYSKAGQRDIQVIHHSFYVGLVTLLSRFDFTISQWAFDGKKVWVSHDGYVDSQHKTLNLVDPQSPLSTFRRIVKFVKEGYKVSSDTYRGLLLAVADNPKLIHDEMSLRHGGDSSSEAG